MKKSFLFFILCTTSALVLSSCNDKNDPADNGDNPLAENPVCGNQIIEKGELCDSFAFDCSSFNDSWKGAATCKSDCKGFDFSGCNFGSGDSGNPDDPGVEKDVCGNSIIEDGEACDKDKISCTSFGYVSGMANCVTDCSGYDTSTCSNEPACGNGTEDAGEVCEPGQTALCTDFGYNFGKALCKWDCSRYDTSSCTEEPSCGNGTVEGYELCDSEAVSCTNFGYTSGMASCDSDCSGFDTTACGYDQNDSDCEDIMICMNSCYSNDQSCYESCFLNGTESGQEEYNNLANCAANYNCQDMNCIYENCAAEGEKCSYTQNLDCGNGYIESGEECDDGNTYDGDGCSSWCTYEYATCGNGYVESGEECDDYNTYDGDGCSSWCTYEYATCGNGIVESGEECDDYNNYDGDGCSSWCSVENTFPCALPDGFLNKKSASSMIFSVAGNLYETPYYQQNSIFINNVEELYSNGSIFHGENLGEEDSVSLSFQDNGVSGDNFYEFNYSMIFFDKSVLKKHLKSGEPLISASEIKSPLVTNIKYLMNNDVNYEICIKAVGDNRNNDAGYFYSCNVNNYYFENGEEFNMAGNIKLTTDFDYVKKVSEQYSFITNGTPIVLNSRGCVCVNGNTDQFVDCPQTEPVCGDGKREGIEICDGNGIDCKDLDSTLTGTAYCGSDCSGYDMTTCQKPVQIRNLNVNYSTNFIFDSNKMNGDQDYLSSHINDGISMSAGFYNDEFPIGGQPFTFTIKQDNLIAVMQQITTPSGTLLNPIVQLIFNNSPLNVGEYRIQDKNIYLYLLDVDVNGNACLSGIANTGAINVLTSENTDLAEGGKFSMNGSVSVVTPLEAGLNEGDAGISFCKNNQ